MKLRKTLAIFLAVVMILAAFTACGKDDGANNNDNNNVTEGSVKTGLAVVTALSSKDTSTTADITLVAVTVDENGVIDDCVIDAVQGKVAFDATGAITTDVNAEVLTKNELGMNYGMNWNEQAQAFADYVTGKTLEEVKGIAVSEGKATDKDLSATVSISVTDFIAGVEKAVANAKDLGAQKGDVLNLTSVTSLAGSKAATADAEGVTETYTTVAAITTKDSTITSCVIDAVQATAKFDATGAITSDLKAAVQTKNELGMNYGMNWFEQAEAFAKYVTGKTLTEAAGVAVSEGKVTDKDLAATVSISVGDFLAVIAKVGK